MRTPEEPNQEQPERRDIRAYEPNPEANFSLMRENLAVGRLRQVHLATEGIVPPGSDTVPVDGPLAIGNIHPDAVTVGKRGSSLLGAVAVAINSVKKAESSQYMFDELSQYNSMTSAATDKVGNIHSNVVRIRSFNWWNVPFLKTVEFGIAPGIMSHLGQQTEDIAIQRMFSILSSAAMIAPLRRRAGKTTWAAVTGYMESPVEESAGDEPEVDDGAEDSNEDSSLYQGRDLSALRADFVVSVATHKRPAADQQLRLINKMHILELFNLHYSYVISPVDRPLKRSLPLHSKKN